MFFHLLRGRADGAVEGAVASIVLGADDPMRMAGAGSVRSLAFVLQAVTSRIANATYVFDLGLQRPAVLGNSNFVILQPC